MGAATGTGAATVSIHTSLRGFSSVEQQLQLRCGPTKARTKTVKSVGTRQGQPAWCRLEAADLVYALVHTRTYTAWIDTNQTFTHVPQSETRHWWQRQEQPQGQEASSQTWQPRMTHVAAETGCRADAAAMSENASALCPAYVQIYCPSLKSHAVKARNIQTLLYTTGFDVTTHKGMRACTHEGVRVCKHEGVRVYMYARGYEHTRL